MRSLFFVFLHYALAVNAAAPMPGQLLCLIALQDIIDDVVADCGMLAIPRHTARELIADPDFQTGYVRLVRGARWLASPQAARLLDALAADLEARTLAATKAEEVESGPEESNEARIARIAAEQGVHLPAGILPLIAAGMPLPRVERVIYNGLPPPREGDLVQKLRKNKELEIVLAAVMKTVGMKPNLEGSLRNGLSPFRIFAGEFPKTPMTEEQTRRHIERAFHDWTIPAPFFRKVVELYYDLSPARKITPQEIQKSFQKELSRAASRLMAQHMQKVRDVAAAEKAARAGKPVATPPPPPSSGGAGKAGTRRERIEAYLEEQKRAREMEQQRQQDALLSHKDPQGPPRPTMQEAAPPLEAPKDELDEEARVALFAKHGLNRQTVEAFIAFFDALEEVEQKAILRQLHRLDAGEPIQNFSGILTKMDYVSNDIYEIRPRKGTSGIRIFIRFEGTGFVILNGGEVKSQEGEQKRMAEKASQLYGNARR